MGLQVELRNRILGMGRSLRGGGWQDGGYQWGRKYGKEGLGKLLEDLKVWRNLMEVYRLHEHKRTHEKKETASLVTEEEGEGRRARAERRG